eukprot:CAMPEP_0119308720 /NCGR_PEP_ID=MMETSP1333-20130426/12314_1 /TAXON_ID=418940 /ORGANISM="Scyphosphaera apsteinii, Strain RCC1455" /LENGTH=69 /DNA_ID=CAMNT_0007312555 /DNA_START=17 /DNA_END=226 /DNA_ORIENTATION=+
MDEEEVEDPKVAVDAKCAATLACAKLMVVYEQCAERIESKGSGRCAGQYMDYTHCVDTCAAHSLFSKLK